jgi:CRISPR-associated protein (Cas_APE2256)
METNKLAFLHASLRAYFCAEALLAQGYAPQQDLAGERYEEAIRFLHDLLPTSRVRTAHELLTQIQQDWAYALHLHEGHDPQALDTIEHVQSLFETHAVLLQSQPAAAQQWQHDIRRQRGRSLHKFLGDFRAALALRHFYLSQGYSAESVVIPHLTYTENRFKMRGLRSLVATLIDLIHRERQQGREVSINATGGFKAEIAYATLVGLLFDVPVYYIHEAFRDIIEMPPTPIGWDYTLLADYEEFFTWVHADLRPTAEVQESANAYTGRRSGPGGRYVLAD